MRSGSVDERGRESMRTRCARLDSQGDRIEHGFGPRRLPAPHRRAAWLVMEERLRDVAELALRCREVCSPLYMPVLTQITAALQTQADELAAAR